MAEKEMKCGDCAAFQKIGDYPKIPGCGFCMRSARVYVQGLPVECDETLVPPVVIRIDGFVAAYPVMHEDDVAFDGIKKKVVP